MADAPLIWAGPILRRVEPRLVTVWVAVDKPCALKLTLFDDRKVVGTEAGVFTGDPGIARAGATTLRVGEKLHVGVVVAELKDPMPALLPGRNYSYNLGFQVKPVPNAMPIDPDTIAPDADLRSLKLLADGTVERPQAPGARVRRRRAARLRAPARRADRPAVAARQLPAPRLRRRRRRRQGELRRADLRRRPDPDVPPRHARPSRDGRQPPPAPALPDRRPDLRRRRVHRDGATCSTASATS